MSASALKSVATDQVKTRTKTIFDYLEDPRVKSGITAVAGKFLTADRMLRLCVNAVKKTPRLLECDPQTVLGAMMTSAALGLEPNTIQQQAFLIPYKKRAKVGNQWVDAYECQFQIGYRGFITLGYRSPYVKSMFAEAVHEGDLFEHMQGSETFLRYAKCLKDRGELTGSFSHVHLENGFETAFVMPLDEILKIRSKSETYNALVRKVEDAQDEKERTKAERNLAETPWVMWADDMAMKSAIKKHAKHLPIASGDALMAAAAVDDRSEAAALDMKAMSDPDLVRSVVGDGAEPPALGHSEPETLEGFRETEVRERETVSVAVSDKAPVAGANQDHAAPTVTLAQLIDRFKRAQDTDVLDADADMIRSLPVEQHDEAHKAWVAARERLGAPVR